jgi:hypothetical protein
MRIRWAIGQRRRRQVTGGRWQVTGGRERQNPYGRRDGTSHADGALFVQFVSLAFNHLRTLLLWKMPRAAINYFTFSGLRTLLSKCKFFSWHTGLVAVLPPDPCSLLPATFISRPYNGLRTLCTCGSLFLRLNLSRSVVCALLRKKPGEYPRENFIFLESKDLVMAPRKERRVRHRSPSNRRCPGAMESATESLVLGSAG